MKNPKETVTSKIGDDYKKWTNDKIILIHARTGAGKSHFIKNTLYDYAEDNNKKILLLSNRNKLKEQNEIALADKLTFGGTITIMNYQKIDFEYSRKMKNEEYYQRVNLDYFDYIVADECQYFVDDADFNNFTDHSLKLIMQSKAVKIFMSATPELFVDYMKRNYSTFDMITYKLKKDYSYIEKLYMYNDDELLEKTLLHDLPKDEKLIYFHHSAKKCLELHEKYLNSIWVCSNSNSLYEKVDKEKINDMLKNEKFEEQMLFATKCFDNGINIKDSNIKHIVIDMGIDTDTIIQCLGRYRVLNSSDKITVYVKNISNQALSGKLRQLEKRLTKADAYVNTPNEVFDYIPREYKDDITFLTEEDDELKIEVNWVKYHKVESTMKFIQELLDKDEKYPFANHIKKLLGKRKWTLYDNEWDLKTLTEYLEDNVGVYMNKSMQEDFKELLDKHGLKVKQGKGMGLNTINGYLKDNELSYHIETKRIRENGKQITVWIITKGYAKSK